MNRGSEQDQWFVVVANPQRENFVAEQLQQHEPYLPKFKTTKGRIAPLFPSYLFVPFIAYWSGIATTVGVRCLLMAGERPATLPGKVIAEWRGKERNGLVVLPPPPRFKTGEGLTITRGALKDRTVVYEGMSGRDRERVLIEMLGQLCTIVVPTVDLVSTAQRNTRNRLRFQRETFIRQRNMHSVPVVARSN
jgi:transcription antitermination factor NusG